MNLRADGLGSEDGALPQPQDLLGSKSQWTIPLGVAQIPPIRWAARALLVLAVALWLGWSGALLVQAWSGRGPAPWIGLTVSAVAGLPWLKLMGRLWKNLAQSRMLPLRWGGLPPRRASTVQLKSPPPGWSVPGWNQRVSVQVVCDLGRWVLVKLASSGGGHPQAWLWIDARFSFQGATGHHLRALLFSARANEVGEDQPQSVDKPTEMASSGDIQRQWSNLLSSFKTTDRDDIERQEAGTAPVALNCGDFAPTVILEFPHRSAQRVGCP